MRAAKILWDKARRHRTFALIGGSVAVFGLVSMYVLVGELHMNEQLAFLITTLISISTNYALNRQFTWKDRNPRFWLPLGIFIMSRIATIPVGQAVFAALNYFMPYLFATVGQIAIMTVVNFLIGDKLVFHPRWSTDDAAKKSPTTNGAV